MRSNRFMQGGGRILAEILIIVVGVLIALAVDNWSTERAEERTEQTYLRSLAEDIEQDVAQIDSARAIIQGRQSAARAALSVIRGNDPVRDTLQLIRDLSRATLLWSYRPIDPTYEDLKSTGNLQLLESVGVRRAISDYYNWRGEDFDRWIQEVFWTRFRPGLYSYLDAAGVAEQFYADASLLETTRAQDVTTLPDLDLAGLRADESVRRALEMIILTMSQQLGLLADQREKGAGLRRLLESSIDGSRPTASPPRG